MSGKILIADDDERLNELLQEIFSMEGYETVPVYNGTEVIREIEKDRGIQLLILDVMMPGLDGWEALEYVKAHFDVKVLVLTALGGENDEVRGLRLGADDFVSKPFGRAVLLERARRLIHEQRKSERKDYVCGRLRISQQECKVYLDSSELRLTTKEYQLLLLLMKNSKVVLDRDSILNKGSGL